MKIKKIQNKKAAMEMSVGTIVTIVLLMSVLVLGIFLIQQIFGTAKGAIDLTDKQIMDQLRKLYGGEDLPVMIFPQTGEIEVKKGNSDAFGLIINNRLESEETFSYKISFVDGGTCGITETQAMSFVAPKERENLRLASGSGLTTPLRINFAIPDSANLCKGILYRLDVSKQDGSIYDGVDLSLTIK